jgi:hypothetical protein
MECALSIITIAAQTCLPINMSKVPGFYEDNRVYRAGRNYQENIKTYRTVRSKEKKATTKNTLGTSAVADPVGSTFP